MQPRNRSKQRTRPRGRRKPSARRRGRAARKTRKGRTARTTPSRRKWSAAVSRRSNALDLERAIFTSRSPAKIAASLKRSAERSKRRKGSPLQSAMSMLNFYENRAGRKLSPTRKKVLERAKHELRKAFRGGG